MTVSTLAAYDAAPPPPPVVIAIAPDAPAIEQQAAVFLAMWAGRVHANSNKAPSLPVVYPTAAVGKTQVAVGVGAVSALG